MMLWLRQWIVDLLLRKATLDLMVKIVSLSKDSGWQYSAHNAERSFRKGKAGEFFKAKRIHKTKICTDSTLCRRLSKVALFFIPKVIDKSCARRSLMSLTLGFAGRWRWLRLLLLSLLMEAAAEDVAALCCVISTWVIVASDKCCSSFTITFAPNQGQVFSSACPLCTASITEEGCNKNVMCEWSRWSKFFVSIHDKME